VWGSHKKKKKKEKVMKDITVAMIAVRAFPPSAG
jgi:hypothetical protein